MYGVWLQKQANMQREGTVGRDLEGTQRRVCAPAVLFFLTRVTVMKSLLCVNYCCTVCGALFCIHDQA